MYLTYEEYLAMGGTLDEPTFNFYRYDVECFIDWYTFDRLHGESEIPDRVKQCVFYLIRLAQTKNNLVMPNADGNTSGSINAQMESQSNDGVTITYSTLHGDMLYINSKKEMEEAVKRYLNGVVNSLGRKLLYRGLYPGE